MANSWNGPQLGSPIRTDVPELQKKLIALLKGDPTSVADIPSGAKRLVNMSGTQWQVQQYNGSSWAAIGKLMHDVDKLDGYHAAITPAASTIAVRNADKKLEGDITGNAATASSAATLSETLPVNKGGTEATTSEQARTNLGVPPTSHTSTAPTYGVGNATQYGHLKLSDATDSASGVSGGVAATPAAAKAAKDAADAAQSSADAAQSSADAAMTRASTLATSSTPGIVKPGTGLQIGEEGTMNVVAEQTGCLPLTGGTMTGNIILSNGGEVGVLAANNEYRYVIMSAIGTNAANFQAFTQDSPILGGAFICRAMDANGNLYDLVGRNDGTLTWRNSPVLLPPGAVFAFAGNWNPPGCLLCNGAAVSRTTYAALFTSISTTYGAGDGSTTFNLPNLIGRYIEGEVTAGIYNNAGLPNATGYVAAMADRTHWVSFRDFSGAIQAAASYNPPVSDEYYTHYIGGYNGFIVDLSKSNSIYGNSTTVQPPAVTMRYYIKY